MFLFVAGGSKVEGVSTGRKVAFQLSLSLSVFLAVIANTCPCVTYRAYVETLSWRMTRKAVCRTSEYLCGEHGCR